jgi:hypothetical protein
VYLNDEFYLKQVKVGLRFNIAQKTVLLGQKCQSKSSFSGFQQSETWFLAERFTERSRASCSYGLQVATPLRYGTEQP